MTRRKSKPRLAIGLRELADLATLDHYERPCAPRILIEKVKDGWRFASPYVDEDVSRWEALLLQAFGTRHGAIMNYFLDVFTRLVGDGHWNEKRKCWMPGQDEFDAMIALVHSMRPQNEAQAAYAAQLCALHVSAMKLGEHCAQSYADDRTRAVLNKTVRAYGDGLERLARLQGKVQPRQVNQSIEVHYHDHRDQRSVTFDGGPGRYGGQPHRAEGAQTAWRPALPSSQPSGERLPSSGRQRETGLSDAWWQRLWSALRRTKWSL